MVGRIVSVDRGLTMMVVLRGKGRNRSRDRGRGRRGRLKGGG